MNGWLLFIALSLTDQGYVPIGEHDGVRVYKREHAKGIDLAGEGVVDASPECVRRVLLDYASHVKWVKNLAESRVLRQDAVELDVYQRLDLPLLHDRDFTLHVTWGRDGDDLWLKFATANERGPAPRGGTVRIDVHEGEWRFTPVDGGRRTFATYRFRIDLAGALPSWMGKGSASKEVPQLFEHLRDQVQYYR